MAASHKALLPSNPLFPLFINRSLASPLDILEWQTAILPHSPSTPLHPFVLLLLTSSSFLLLFFLLRRLHSSPSSPSLPFLTPYLTFFSTLPPHSQVEWLSYVISSLHALLATLLGALTLSHSLASFHTSYLAHLSPSSPSPSPSATHLSWFLSTTLSQFASSSSTPSPSSFHLALSCAFSASFLRDCALMVTCGYLLFDLLLCLHSLLPSPSPPPTPLASPLTFLHHALILCAFSFGLWARVGSFYAAFFLLNEASTLFLNANYFLAASSLSQRLPTAYLVNALLLLTAFAILRVLGNVLCIAHIGLVAWAALRPLWWGDWGQRWMMGAGVRAGCALMTALAVGHVAINLAWFGMLVKAVLRKWRNADVVAVQHAEKGVSERPLSNHRKKTAKARTTTKQRID